MIDTLLRPVREVVRNIQTSFRNLLQIFRALLAHWHLFRLLHFQIPNIFNRMPQFFQVNLQPRPAQRRRSHIYTTPALSQVHGHTDNPHFLRHKNTRLSEFSIRMNDQKLKAAISSSYP